MNLKDTNNLLIWHQTDAEQKGIAYQAALHRKESTPSGKRSTVVFRDVIADRFQILLGALGKLRQDLVSILLEIADWFDLGRIARGKLQKYMQD